MARKKGLPPPTWMDEEVDSSSVTQNALTVAVPPLPKGKSLGGGKAWVQVLQQKLPSGLKLTSNGNITSTPQTSGSWVYSNIVSGLKVATLPRLRGKPGRAILSLQRAQKLLIEQLRDKLAGSSVDTPDLRAALDAAVAGASALGQNLEGVLKDKKYTFVTGTTANGGIRFGSTPSRMPIVLLCGSSARGLNLTRKGSSRSPRDGETRSTTGWRQSLSKRITPRFFWAQTLRARQIL